MKEIVERLQEQRNIELAKTILESHGYEVSKKSKGYKVTMNEDKGQTIGDTFKWTGVHWAGVPGDKYRADEYLPVGFENSEEHMFGCVYLSGPGSYEAIIHSGDFDTVEYKEFKSYKEAKKWIEDWFSSHK